MWQPLINISSDEDTIGWCWVSVEPLIGVSSDKDMATFVQVMVLSRQHGIRYSSICTRASRQGRRSRWVIRGSLWLFAFRGESSREIALILYVSNAGKWIFCFKFSYRCCTNFPLVNNLSMHGYRYEGVDVDCVDLSLKRSILREIRTIFIRAEFCLAPRTRLRLKMIQAA